MTSDKVSGSWRALDGISEVVRGTCGGSGMADLGSAGGSLSKPLVLSCDIEMDGIVCGLCLASEFSRPAPCHPALAITVAALACLGRANEESRNRRAVEAMA